MSAVRPCPTFPTQQSCGWRPTVWATIGIGVFAMSETQTAAQGRQQIPGGGETENARASLSSKAYPNVPMPTAGGNQVWTDHRNHAGWRIQQNLLTGHWRLLDPKDIRRCWGSRQACEAALESATEGAADVGTPDHVIILIHGLMRTQRSMNSLNRHLQGRLDAKIIRFSYASTRAGIADHAEALRELVEALPGQPRVDFVGHSMGNIVIRHAIGDWQRGGENGHEVLSRLGRVVMLGPPNQGAAIARRLGELGLFETIVGKGGMELGPKWQNLEDRLAVPPCPFAIVAGDLSPNLPKNPLVDGASDFIVSVEEAKLDGATEFHRVAVMHSVIMDDPQVKKIVEQFLVGRTRKGTRVGVPNGDWLGERAF